MKKQVQIIPKNNKGIIKNTHTIRNAGNISPQTDLTISLGETSAEIQNIAINARNATPNDLKVFVFTKDLLYVFISINQVI